MIGRKHVAAAVFAVAFPLVSPNASAKDQIRILCPTWPGFAPVFVAQDLGYFDKLDLDVSIKFEDERPNVMAAMARGDIEMDLRSIGEYQGRPRDENTPGVLIGTIDESVGGDGVVVDGAIQSVADLRGKAVASEPNIPGRLLLQVALKKAGMTLADVKMKEIVTADTVGVFTDPSISAVASFEPFLSQAVKNDTARNPRILISSSQYPGIVVDVIIVRQDDLAQHPAKYRNFLVGLYKAVQYFQTNPDDFVRLAAAHLKLSPKDFRASIDGNLVYTSLDKASQYLGRAGTPGTLFGVFDTVMQLNLENGAADHRLIAAKSIDNSVIGQISDDDLKLR
jgi:NitT/TauT family transport system substrate-binding protein